MGVDIGGTGIKGAPVDVDKGELAGERFRILTPKPATPKAVADVVADVVDHFGWKGPVGATFPAVVKDGVTLSAANVDKEWIGANAAELFSQRIDSPVTVLNDADAAGLAEMRFGAGLGEQGVVFVLTLGTGVGSGMFNDGVLVPNTELGHMEIRGRDAERRSAAAARVRRGLSWKAWAQDLEEHLQAIDKLFSPNLIILGGGVSKNADKYIPRLTVKCPVVPAQLRNDAGIIGAAIVAAEAKPHAPSAVPVIPTVAAAPSAGASEPSTEPAAEAG